MIKLTSFYPFSNFLKVTQEFHEDKAIVKIKSLNAEREFEFDYKDVTEISDAFLISSSQNTFSFWLLAMTAFVLSLFCNLIYSNLILFRLTQIIYVCAILLYVTSFIKSWHIYFRDKNDNLLTSVKQTRRNQDSILKIVEIIRNKSENVREISSANPFPEAKPSFEHTEYDIPNIKKTTERFYENEILGFQKNMAGEYVYRIKYSTLSRKVYRGKESNQIWGWVLTIFVLIISVLSGFSLGFRIDLGTIYLYIIYVLLGILAISFMLSFVKREAIGLYDLNGNVAHSIWVNRSNKEKVEEIVKFIKSKIPPQNKG